MADLTQITTAPGVPGLVMRTATGAPDGYDSSSSSSDGDKAGDGDGDGDKPPDLGKGSDKFEPLEPKQHHHRESSAGDEPAPSPPPTETGADLTEAAAASHAPDKAEQHQEYLLDGDPPSSLPPYPAPVADLLEDPVASEVLESIEWRNNYSLHGESPVQRLLIQVKELRVKQILISAVTLLAHFAALPETSIVEAADHARQASRLAAGLGVSEALKGRCAYYEGFAKFVLGEKFGIGLPLPSYLYGDHRADDYSSVICFRRAEAAQDVCREGTWATEWLVGIPKLKPNPTVSRRKRAAKRKKSSSLREIDGGHDPGTTMRETSTPDIRGNFTRTAAGERMRAANARDRMPVLRDEMPRVERIDTSVPSASLERQRHVKPRSIPDYRMKIPGSFPEDETLPESEIEVRERPRTSTPEQKFTRWCVIQ